MPRIGVRVANDVPEVRPTIEDIQQAVADIEYLMNGRLDHENIWKSGDTFVQHSPKDVVDLADTTRPITGHKLFGGDDFEENILTPLVGLIESNKRLRLVSGSCSFVFGGDSSDVPSPDSRTYETFTTVRPQPRGTRVTSKPDNVSVEFYDNPNPKSPGGFVDMEVSSVVTTSNYVRKVSIPVAPNYKPLKFRDMEDIYRVTPDIDTANLPRFSKGGANPADLEDPFYVYYPHRNSLFASKKVSVRGDWFPGDTSPREWSIEVSRATFGNDAIEFDVVFSSRGSLPDGKFLNIDVAIDFLCEEVL